MESIDFSYPAGDFITVPLKYLSSGSPSCGNESSVCVPIRYAVRLTILAQLRTSPTQVFFLPLSFSFFCKVNQTAHKSIPFLALRVPWCRGCSWFTQPLTCSISFVSSQRVNRVSVALSPSVHVTTSIEACNSLILQSHQPSLA